MMCSEIGNQRSEELRSLSARWRSSEVPSYSRSQRAGKPFDFDCPQRQAVVCLGSGGSRRALDRVEPVHVAIGIAAHRKITRVTSESRKPCIQEISVQREDYVGTLQLVLRFHRLTVGHLRAG